MKTVVLTSKQNYVWQSMQEIIPFLLKSWKATESPEHQVEILNVDSIGATELLTTMLSAQNLVLACFTPKLARLAGWLRLDLQMDFHIFLHLHHQATIGCWPFRKWGGEHLFRQCDVFISSCERDRDCLAEIYPDASCVVIPFSAPEPLLQPPKLRPEQSSGVSFVSIGRISSQKNLHTLLVSLSHYNQLAGDSTSWTLDIFGAEDGLGSPNMGRRDRDYQLQLIELANHLGLDSNIIFHGHRDRTEIAEFLHQRRRIFVAPSLHSDENFGMAAFQCLRMGHLAVLSDWGGHADFERHFPQSVWTAQVFQTQTGPTLHPFELAQKLRLAAVELSRFPVLETKLPKAYELSAIATAYQLQLQRPQGQQAALRASALAEHIFAQVKDIAIQDNPVLFDSYAAAEPQILFRAYGMRANWPVRPLDNGTSDIFTLPWVFEKADRLEFADPHRGSFALPNRSETQISRQEWLWQTGGQYSETLV